MKRWLESLDKILRGEATRPSHLKQGLEQIPLGGLTLLTGLMGALYGICMGAFAIVNRENPQYMQIVASMIKVPALYLLTLVVTLPSLYVFNALVGSRLQVMGVVRLLVASLAVTLTVLASFGPIVAFFSLTTTSYPFMKLLNVAVFALSGFLGLGFLLQTMNRLTLFGHGEEASGRTPAKPLPTWHEPKSGETSAGNLPSTSAPNPSGDKPDTNPEEPASQQSPTPASASSSHPKETPTTPPFSVTITRLDSDEPRGALDFLSSTSIQQNVRRVFICWVILFGLVGAQMSWVLRPFIGAPDRTFEWFRARESNFFDAVLRAITDLFR